MMLDKRNREEMPLENQISIAFDILNYNQGLIQFADGKANGLLLINSIFIASVAPFIEAFRKGAGGFGMLLLVGFFVLCVVSIMLSMGVIMNRKLPEVEDKNRGLIFYGHIVESRSPEGYMHEFHATEAVKFKENLLTNVYTVSQIATRKYQLYSFAQGLTLLSCITWILTIAYLLFTH